MSNQIPANWRREHFEELDREYPEQTNNADPATLAYRAGQRSVIKWVEYRLSRKAKEG